SQETAQDNAFLDSWSPGPSDSGSPHRTLSASTGSSSCMLCHQGTFGFGPFTVFAIGTDLTNDHPVGVQLPSTTTFDFNDPGTTVPGLKFFDVDRDGRADTNEVRFYDTGEGYEVECASCHDPHGVKSGGSGAFIPSFLRVSNAGSNLCLTCHAK
ncbi:Cytochrome c family protein, partial [hydrothermal vent metagenome]